MKRLKALIATIMITASTVPVSLAQAPGTGAGTAPPGTGAGTNPPAVTGMKPDRTIADPAARKAMRAKEAALRQKRADCRKQARLQKVPLLKRNAFVRACVSKS